MVNSIKLFLCSLVCAALILGGESSDVQDEWNRLTSIVFSQLSRRQPSLKTHEDLNRLAEIYPKLEAENSVSEGDKDKFNIVKDLLRFGEVNQIRCTADSFKDFNLAMDIYQVYRQNILTYLRHFQAQLFNFCKPQFDAQLRKAVSHLSEQQQQEAQLLTRKSIKSSRGDESSKRRRVSRLSLERLEKGSLAFLKYQSLNKSGSKLTRQTSRKDFEELFEDSIGKLCSVVNKELEVPMEFYLQVLYHHRLAEKLDSFALDWIATVKICRSILLELEETRDVLYHSLSNPEKSDRWICFSCRF